MYVHTHTSYIVLPRIAEELYRASARNSSSAKTLATDMVNVGQTMPFAMHA